MITTYAYSTKLTQDINTSIIYRLSYTNIQDLFRKTQGCLKF